MDDSTTIRTVRFRVLPGNRAKARALNSLAGACRYVWNQTLADHEDSYRIARMNGAKPPGVSFFTLSNGFTDLRRATPWLQDHSFNVVRHTLKRQADAWSAFFAGDAGRPRFKSRHADKDGFTIPERVRINGDSIHVPKIGKVRLRRRGGNPYADGDPRTATFARRNGKWYCTIAYRVAEPAKCANGRTVGVDMNVRQIATSDGQIHRMPDLGRLDARRRRYQRMVSRRRKGSGRRERAKALLAKTSARIAAIRDDWQHQATRRIADRAEVVCIEDLRTKAMTAKGGPRKRGLNREVLATGWSGLQRMLDYKAAAVVEVNPAYTSQTCAECGHIARASRRSQSEFECVGCGHRDNADVNAARNIRRQGLARLHGEGRSDCRPLRPVKTGSPHPCGATQSPMYHAL